MTTSRENTLNVMIVAPTYWPDSDPGSRTLQDVATGLHSAGAAISVIAPRSTAKGDVALGNVAPRRSRILSPIARPPIARSPVAARHQGIDIIRLAPSKQYSGECHSRRLKNWLRAHADAIDVVLVSGLQRAARTCVRACHGAVPVVLRAEQAGMAGDCHWQVETAKGERVKRWCLKADAFIAPCPAIQQELIAAGYPRDRIHLCPVGLNSAPHEAIPSRAHARQVLAGELSNVQRKAQAPLVVCLDPPAAEKALGTLIMAWAKLIEFARQTDAVPQLLLPAGRAAAGSLRDQIASAGLSGSVHVVDGAADQHTELQSAIMPAADLILCPNRLVNVERKQLEAMSVGRCLMMARTPAAAHLAAGGECGWLVEGETADHWANAIKSALAEPGKCDRIGAAARRHVSESFSYDAMIESHLRLLRKLAGG